MSGRPEFDVAVVGAGPVGSAAALLLGQAGLRTALVDRGRFPRDKPCGEGLMPSGAAVLDGLGIDLAPFPAVKGVTYQVPGLGSISGNFGGPVPGRGARRLRFDTAVATAASRQVNVHTAFGVAATGIELQPNSVRLETTMGSLRSRILIGADGLHSQVATWMGWYRPPRPPHRYGLVGHIEAPGHGFDRIMVTLLAGCEVYLAPTSPDELLVALLGGKGAFRLPGSSVRATYLREVMEAHPSLEGCAATHLRGAGPFRVRPARVASSRVFLLGDAAGFLDPLTGDGITAGLVAARCLSTMLRDGGARIAETFARWEGGQWRRRRMMSRLALTLTRSRHAARAIHGLQRRPRALDRLLEVNEGSRSPLSLSLADWLALAGL